MKKAVIMAGGFGTRLRPLTMTIPKPMVPIMNKPMMEHIVNLLKKHNITDIVSVLYFHPKIITAHFEDGAKFGIDMTYVTAHADYGTAGSVKNAHEHLNERFIIISGDVLTDIDLTAALKFHEEKGAMATILLTRVTDPLQYGIVMTDDDNKITRFLEKPSWGQVFSDTINTGIYILEPEVLDLIPYQEEFDFSKDLFPTMLSKELPLYGFITDGYWKDVGNLNEYQQGQTDSIVGNVNLGFDGKEKGHLISKSAVIPESVKIEGVLACGDNTVIGEGCVIANSVIGNNVKIGNGCQLDGVTIWDNVIIGDFAVLKDNVICNDTTIGDYARIAENTFIAEHCEIADNVIINSNLKLWPEKQVEEGAKVVRSLVQEYKWSRELFTEARISGLSNIDINPEFGAKLGAAMGLVFKTKGTVLASRDPDGVSRIMKRSITAGLASVGVNVNDLQQISIPQTRQELRSGKYDAGLHVRRSPRNKDLTDIIIFNKDGRDIPTSITKKIERFFFGEDITRAHYAQVGKLFYPERTNEIYITRFVESLNVDLIRERKFKLLMDYSFGLASQIFPNILGELGAEVLSLHNYVDSTKFHPDPTEFKEDGDNTGKIMSSLGYELGFRMQAGAEKISLIDQRGEWISQTRFLSILTKLFLETNRHREPYKIAVSIVATNEIEQIAKDYNVEVIRIKNNHSAMMDATIDESVIFVGGIYGGYIFTDFLYASDGMFTVGKLLEMLAQTGLSTYELDETLPRQYQCVKEVLVPWNTKGKIMRRAMEHSENKDRALVEGVKIFEQDTAVLILPDKEKGAFTVFSEAPTEKLAKSKLEEYVELINTWKKK